MKVRVLQHLRLMRSELLALTEAVKADGDLADVGDHLSDIAMRVREVALLYPELDLPQRVEARVKGEW